MRVYLKKIYAKMYFVKYMYLLISCIATRGINHEQT